MLIPHSRRKRIRPPMATVIGTMVAVLAGVGVSAAQHEDRTVMIAIGVVVGLIALGVVVVAFIRSQNIQH